MKKIRLPLTAKHTCKAWTDHRVKGIWRRKCVRCGALKPNRHGS